MQVNIILSLSIFFLHNASSCWFAANIDKMTCTSLREVSGEGSESWNKLHLFNENRLLHLKKDTFKRTPNLVDLTVANIASIETGSFNGLNKLDKLTIFKSELEEIPLGILDDLPIRNLQVFVTKVKSIAPGCFRNLPDISLVDLRNNSITEVPTGVFDNTKIFKLYLGNNGLEKIADKAFENMTDLSYLSFHGNLINSFSSESYLGTSISLTQLWLTKNKLKKITKDMFGTIPNLTHLYVEYNLIETIEKASFHLIPFLEFLDISNNKLQQIEPNIFLLSGMKGLLYISMQNNQFTFVNKAVFLRTPALKFITYGGNPFQCPCSQELDNIMKEKKITRVCDKDYISGERPSCIFTSSAPKECIYDEDSTSELHKLFQEAVQDYPTLELKCDTRKGIANGFLNNIENV